MAHERATQISLNTWSPGSRKENSRKVSVSGPMCYRPVWQVLASAVRYCLPHCCLHLNWIACSKSIMWRLGSQITQPGTIKYPRSQCVRLLVRSNSQTENGPCQKLRGVGGRKRGLLSGHREALCARTTASLSMVSMRFIHTVPVWEHLPF